jgi:hypothetical protein
MTEPSASRQRPTPSRIGHLLMFPSTPGRSRLPLDASTCVASAAPRSTPPGHVPGEWMPQTCTPSGHRATRARGAGATHKEIPLSAYPGIPAHAGFRGHAASDISVQFVVIPIKKPPVPGRHSAPSQPNVQPHKNGPQHAAQPSKWQPSPNNL